MGEHEGKCLKCDAEITTLNRTGTCVKCRTVKCQAEKCGTIITVKEVGENYCKQHNYMRQRRKKIYVD